MVKLIKEANGNAESIQKFSKALSNTEFSDNQVDTIRRAQKMFAQLSNANLNVMVEINQKGQVKLSIPIGNSGVTTIIENDSNDPILTSANKLVINQENLRTLENILNILSKL